MKRYIALLLGLALMMGAYSQSLKIGTTETAASHVPIVVKIFKEAGYDAQVEVFSQARLFVELGKKELDGAFFLSDASFGTEEFALLKVPVILDKTDFVAVALDPAVKVSSIADLAKYTVGILQESAPQTQIAKDMKPIITVNEAAQFKMLAAGRFQVAIAVRPIVPIMAQVAGIKTYYVQEPALMSIPVYFGLHKSKEAMLPAITAKFKEWMESGKWAKEFAAIKAAEKK